MILNALIMVGCLIGYLILWIIIVNWDLTNWAKVLAYCGAVILIIIFGYEFFVTTNELVISLHSMKQSLGS